MKMNFMTFVFVCFSTRVTFASIRMKLEQSTSDGNEYWSTTKNITSATSRMQCASFVLNLLNSGDKSKSQPAALKFDKKSKTCSLGTLGPMSGDFRSSAQVTDSDIYISVENCLASSDVFGPGLVFYFSFMDDNPLGIGIFKHLGSTYRARGNPYEVDHVWPAEKQRYLDVIPFQRPISGKTPFKTQGISMIIFTHPHSVILTKITAFHWMFFEPAHFGSAHHKIIYFGETETSNFFAIEMNKGYISFGVVEIDGNHYDYNTQLRFTSFKHSIAEQWLYIGVTYDLQSGAYKVYENGVRKSSGTISGVASKSIKYIKTRPRMACATTEIYDNAWNDQEVADHYQKALYFLGENCTPQGPQGSKNEL